MPLTREQKLEKKRAAGRLASFIATPEQREFRKQQQRDWAARTKDRRKAFANTPLGTCTIRLRSLKHRDKQRGNKCVLTVADLVALWDKQYGLCALSGLPLQYAGSGAGAASVDRIDSAKGYTPDNIQWVHSQVNRAKSDLTQKDFLAMCEGVTTMKEEQWES